MSVEDLPLDRERMMIAKSNDHDGASDEFFEQMSSQLGESAQFPDDASPSHDVLWLLEENARLRTLAVKLSVLVGDLSEREWSNALAAAELATLSQVRSPRP
jgi:hypothetical protein